MTLPHFTLGHVPRQTQMTPRGVHSVQQIARNFGWILQDQLFEIRARDKVETDIIRPKRPDLATYESRLATFSNWPEDHPFSKEDLARSDFFYSVQIKSKSYNLTEQDRDRSQTKGTAEQQEFIHDAGAPTMESWMLSMRSTSWMISIRGIFTEMAQQIETVALSLGDHYGANCYACTEGTLVHQDVRKLESGNYVVVGAIGNVYRHDRLACPEHQERPNMYP
ncbi:hypothetical protein EGW08_006431 [Elysia chlorotica]|uniref:Uncharacterized protein n=1 Tax=Elysia chlorotica TaxID=188477 RepID=A0A3S1BPN7_ELYCH|nr:hypothetical protein EGW08_006431 [Elysia chlorotica]